MAGVASHFLRCLASESRRSSLHCHRGRTGDARKALTSCEAPMNPKKNRERMIEMLFEKPTPWTFGTGNVSGCSSHGTNQNICKHARKQAGSKQEASRKQAREPTSQSSNKDKASKQTCKQTHLKAHMQQATHREHTHTHTYTHTYTARQ